MEYCEGNTLKQLIDRGILQEKPKMIWKLLREILDGLKHMHTKVIENDYSSEIKISLSYRVLFIEI